MTTSDARPPNRTAVRFASHGERYVYAFGQRVRLGRKWYSVVSLPHPHRAGCYVWRDGCTYTTPEFVNWRAEQRVVHAPPPLDDLPPRYVTVSAMP